ncbi:MAG: hypothetical protein R3A48_20250 [Polyangiales bacterium]
MTRTARAGAALVIGVLGCAHAPMPRRVARLAPPRTASAGAEPLSEELAARVERVTDVLRGRGATVLAERWSGFIERGASRGFSIAVDRPQCVAFLGVSPQGVADLNLVVVDAAGTELARDERADAHPYARVCLRRPGELHVFATVSSGSGQVAVLTAVSPPLVPPPLDEALGGVPTGLVTGPRTPRGAIGADRSRPEAGVLLTRLLAPYAAQGWRPVGAPGEGALHHQEIARWTLLAEAGRCYLLQGVGGEGVDDLDLVVHAPDGSIVAQDVALDSTPAVRFCPAASGAHGVEVRMYAGAGRWALRALEMPAPVDRAEVRDLDPVGRARHRELVLDAESRGMSSMGAALRGAPWGSLVTTAPLRVEAGRCYLVGAAADAAVAGLDLWIADPLGAVLASDTNERERAAVFHCARRDEALTVHVRTANARGTWVMQSFVVGGRS